MYAELHCHSNFSFLAGGSHPETLAERAAALGIDALALTDCHGVYGAIRFQQAAKAAGIKAIIGAEVTLQDGAQVVLLVRDPAGYRNLSRLLTHALMTSPRGAPRASEADLWTHAEGLLLLAGRSSPVQRALRIDDASSAARWFERAREAFGPRHVFLEGHRHLREGDDTRFAQLRAFAKAHDFPAVVSNDVRYATAADRLLYDVLSCVREHTNLDAAGPILEANAERRLKGPAEMKTLFKDAPDWVQRTLEVAQLCAFDMEQLQYRLPAFDSGGEDHVQLLRRVVYEGAVVRYGDPLSQRVRTQLEYELDVITRLEFAGYFLIVWDVVRFCRERGILCQGRGSAANSAVCYCLGITAIDPIGMELLFERFLSTGRAEPPDIDMDIAHNYREEVIQYVYNKYGREHAGMVCEVITYQRRSAARDIGKALGLSLDQVDRIAKHMTAVHPYEKVIYGKEMRNPSDLPYADAPPPPPSPARGEGDKYPPHSGGQPRHQSPPSSRGGTGTGAGSLPRSGGGLGWGSHDWGVDLDSPQIRLLIELVERVWGFPRHLSIHVGGMVVSADPLSHVVPVEPASMKDRSVIQWDKDDAAAAGLIKIDLLGLGMLTLLQEGFQLIERNHGKRIELHQLEYSDPAVFDLLCKADTVGVFQVESRAQMNTLPRLKPRCFYDLVVEVALIRPGPIQGEMVHPYLRRREGKEAITYPHPDLIPILQRTLGIPLFQEQGMRVAVVAAGFSAAEADELRRAMGHKRSRARMQVLLHKLIRGMERNGYASDIAERIVKQLTAFADYGFPESHAAGFAILVYASAWMKHHYPAEFYTALLNAQPMGFYSPATIVGDAQRRGISVKSADVCRSEYDTTAEDGGLRLGLRTIRGLGDAYRESITAILARRPFAGLESALETFGELPMNLRRNLITAGAFDGFGVGRREVRWAFERQSRGRAGPLDVAPAEGAAPLHTLTQVEEMQADYKMTGLSVRHQPLAFYRGYLRQRGCKTAKQLLEIPNGASLRIGGLVICRQRPGTAKGMLFLTLEDETGLANIVVFPHMMEKYRKLFVHTPLIIVTGKLERENNVTNIIANAVEAMPTLDRGGQMSFASRDFR
jgi:error-prone DNA polymerase